MKLDDRDERLLALLGTRPGSLSTLDEASDGSHEELRGRLADLVDNGLVTDLGDGRYERTESGRRVLVTSAAGIHDERVDTSPEIERVIDEFSLRADEADAVRHAFAFLRYWGRVSEEELVDGVYSEAPAGRENADEWWADLVRDTLVALPGVESPSGDGPWLYSLGPEAADPSSDGRRVLSRTHPVYGDVKHALESLDLTDGEREGARAAFRHLYRRGDVTERELRETVFPEHTAGYRSSTDWWDDVVRDAFEALPGVERTHGDTWRYRRS